MESVVHSNSVLLLDELATAAECQALIDEASEMAHVELKERAMLEELGMLDETMENDAGRVRMHVRDRLRANGQALCDKLLLRALHELRTRVLACDTHAAFGDCLETSSCIGNPRLAWSPGEPAVNVYVSGGQFKPHEDEQSLSILIPLTDATTFSGGGTAFWSASARGPEDEHCQRTVTGEPCFVLTPPAGSAIVFGGQATHAAQPVASGERCVLVGSFSA